MAEKCTFSGVKMTPCDNLKNVVHDTNGNCMGLTFRNVSNMKHVEEDYLNGVILKHGRKKTDMVVISFCPACGENIEPRYQE